MDKDQTKVRSHRRKVSRGGNSSFVLGCAPGGGKPAILSDAEREILRLYADEKYTPAQVAIVYKCSVQYARRIRRKLIGMGVMNEAQQQVSFFASTPPLPAPSSGGSAFRFWRIHGCEYSVRILEGHTGERYRFALKRSSIIQIQGVTIELARGSIKVKDTNSYTSDKPEKASWSAWEAFFKLAPRMERDLGVILVKDRSQNIKRVNAHFARVNDEGAVLATDLKDSWSVPTVYHNEDGKLRFKVDCSKGPPEAEFLHPRDGERDSVRYADFVQDLLEHDHLPLSEISQLLAHVVQTQDRTARLHAETAEGLRALTLFLRSQIPYGLDGGPYGQQESTQEDSTKSKRPDYLG